jgi:pre-mRNA-splicing factor SYF2
MHDYHNPEGQHRNYERNLKSLVRTETEAAASADTYNPLIDTSVDQAKERNGARLLANEMKRRMDKAAKKKRERMDFEETDVSYINKRNKRFNEKINRTYDKHTAEIRQNLERGTAL